MNNAVNLRLLLNGITNYSGGIYNQIQNCEAIMSYLCGNNDKGELDVIANVLELSSFLSSIARLGNIEKIQRHGYGRYQIDE